MKNNVGRWMGSAAAALAGLVISLSAGAASMPQWMVSPPPDDGQFWYGTGEAPDLSKLPDDASMVDKLAHRFGPAAVDAIGRVEAFGARVKSKLRTR